MRTSTSEFAQQNQDHLTANNLDLMAAIKNGESLIPTSPPKPTPIMTTGAVDRSSFTDNRYNLLLIMIVLIVLVGVVGGILLYLKKKESQTDNLL